MDFIEAVKAKVRNEEVWLLDEMLNYDEKLGIVLQREYYTRCITNSDIDSDQWRVEDKKTLSDRIEYKDQIQEPEGWLKVVFVRRYIREFVDWVVHRLEPVGGHIEEKAKEKFGKMLIK